MKAFVGFPFKYHLQVSAVSGALFLCQHIEQHGAAQYQVVLCMTVTGSPLLPCMWFLIRDQKGIFGKGATAEIWRKLAFWRLCFIVDSNCTLPVFFGPWSLSAFTQQQQKLLWCPVFWLSQCYKGVSICCCSYIEFMVTLLYNYRVLINWVTIKRRDYKATDKN